jgi:hypothetical protein
MPNQKGGTVPASKYFRETDESRAIADDARTTFMTIPPILGRLTTKSKFNELAKV